MFKTIIAAALTVGLLTGCAARMCEASKRDAERAAEAIALCSHTEGCETNSADFREVLRLKRNAEFYCAAAAER